MSRPPQPLDVAIVGMACRFAGASDLFAFWEDVVSGRSTIREVPEGRLRSHLFESSEILSAGRRGGYLDEAIELDARAMGEMPGTVETEHPGRYLVLDTVKAALLDAGMRDGFPDELRVEVVIGRTKTIDRKYLNIINCRHLLEKTRVLLDRLNSKLSADELEATRTELKAALTTIEAATLPERFSNSTAGWVAERLGRSWSAFEVDAENASSLVALNRGAKAIASSRVDLAIVGGIHIEVDGNLPVSSDDSGVWSRSGRPRPFTAEADGMVSGEGVGVVVLRRLRDAEHDGDRIYAVLKGVGLARDLRSRGLSSPDVRGLLRAIRRSYRRSGIDPATVGLIEGQGLSVPTADREELRALRAAFPTVGSGQGRVLGAVSGQVGHAMSASGMAGLIKAALALHHRVLPQSGVVGDSHPMLVRSKGRLEPNRSSRPWISGRSVPRRAGVNAFGDGGLNVHAVLESHPTSDGDAPGGFVRWPDEAILLTGSDRARLIDRVRHLVNRLRRRPALELKDVAATLNEDAIRSDGPARLGLVVGSVPELIDRLESVARLLDNPARGFIRDACGAYYWDQPAGPGGRLAFLFPGEGSQYPGMLGDVCQHFPEVRECFDQIDRMAIASGAIEPPGARLFGAGAGSEVDPTFWEAGTAVPVVFGSQWGLYRLLGSLGLRPDAVCGHSSGEIPALVASGAISEDGMLGNRLIELAGIFSALERSGGVAEGKLLSVGADRGRVEEILAGIGDGVSVAADNCPHQVLVVSAPGSIEEVRSRLKSEGISSEVLPFSRAYHSPAFESAVGPIRDFFESIPMRPPSIPIYSCCLAARVADEPTAIRRIAVEQWTRPVEFRRTIEAMYADGIRLFVDVGARGNLAGFVEDTLRGRDAFAVAAIQPRRPGLTQLNHLVASLFAQGVSVDPTRLFIRRRPRPVDLEAGPIDSPGTMSLRLGFPVIKLGGHLGRETRDYQGTVETAESRSAQNSQSKRSGYRFERSQNKKSEISFKRKVRSENLNYLLCRDDRELHLDGRDPEPPVSLKSDGIGLPGVSDGDQERSGGAGLPSGRLPLVDPGLNRQGFEGEGKNIIEPNCDRASCLDSRSTAPVGALDGRRVMETILDAAADPVAEHHTFGGRRVSAVDPALKGLPVLPFTVMAELLAEAAAPLVPGMVLVGLENVQARRWIRYEDEPVLLEIVAEADGTRPGVIRARLFNRGIVHRSKPEGDLPAVEASVVFSNDRLEAPEASVFELRNAEVSRFTAESLYGEQWLFHGPAFRAVCGLGAVSDRGIEGTLRVLPRHALRRNSDAKPSLIDPIVLDAFTHLLGCWGLERLAEGDVIFPMRLRSLDVFGTDPPEGSEVTCRIAVKQVERHRVMADAEIVREDGRVWMRLCDWEDWRFYWPPRYRDVFRMPDRVLLGEPLQLPVGETDAKAVWLRPPEDMGRPVWRDVLEHIQLSPEERSGCLKSEGDDQRRTLRLWGRIAAKETVRRLWLAEGRGPVYPADLTIEPDSNGRPMLRSRIGDSGEDLPVVSISHTEGVAVALGCRDSKAHVGIDVEPIVPRKATFEDLAFGKGERALLDRFDPSRRPEWIARFWCAREAVAKATGLGMIDGPRSVEVVAVDPASGRVAARLGPRLQSACPALAGFELDVGTGTNDGYAWAWVVRREGER